MKSSIAIITLWLFLSEHSYAQQVEVGLSFGSSVSNIDFHHTSEVTTDDDKEFQTYWNSNFGINLSASISKKNWYLKSEIGFLKINSHFTINYQYDEGFGSEKGSIATFLTNQKIYFSIAPQFRKQYSSTLLKFSGGPLITSDISNVMTSRNSVLLPKSSPLGFKIETGLVYNIKNIGFEFNIGYVKIGQSILQNFWHPKISYNLIMASFGVVYSISSESSME